MFSGVGNALFTGKRHAAKILVANERTRQSLPTVIKDEQIAFLVENGVDLDLWNPQPTGKADPPSFVFVGRLVWWKAVELLIEAFESARADATLTIVGDGPERARLEKLAAASDAGGRITFAGFRPQTEIRDILARSTALVLPSMRECGGAVVLEAFACRTPAIATNWGGPEDYITPETGVLVDPVGRAEFIHALAGAMNDLANDPHKAARMGDAARSRVEENYTWAAKARQMIEIYQSAIETAQ
jgi:glycosyltransferase involved in cell wall biosynthesis